MNPTRPILELPNMIEADWHRLMNFWNNVKSFPLGLYCSKYTVHYALSQISKKDCGTCRHLKFGRCSKNIIPYISNEAEQPIE